MQLLCTSDSIAFIQTLRIALEGEDIEIHYADPQLNPVGLFGPVAGAGGRIYVLNEEDWQRAVEIYRDLSNARTPAQPAPQAGGLSIRWIAIAAVIAAIVAVGILMSAGT